MSRSQLHDRRTLPGNVGITPLLRSIAPRPVPPLCAGVASDRLA